MPDVSQFMPPMTAADFCDRNAESIGNKEAIVDRHRRLTWSQVKDLSDRLAVGLINLGLQRNALILVQLPNWAELFLVRLAAEKAGLRLITVTAAFRYAELFPIVQFTKPEVVITLREYRDFNHYELFEKIRIPELKHILIAGEDLPSGALSLEETMDRAQGPLQHAERRHRVSDVCQIATTSGSTGIPKCVEVPLYTRLLTGWIHTKRFNVTSADTLAAVTPIVTGTADALVYNGGCLLGARLILIDHFSPQETCSLLESEGVTVIPLVPTLMARIIAMPNLSKYKFALRVVVNHGSILPFSQGAETEERLGCRIMQGYGSVDCGGIAATCWDDPREVRLGTVGRPLDGNDLRIVDSEGRDVRAGETGRLLVRGPHTNARFFRNPDLNSAKRLDGYFDVQELVRVDDGGNLILMGREQDLIIRGGQNIYPADIEAALVRHPKILEACVVGLPDQDLGESVCAYVVCRSEEVVTISDVSSFLENVGLARFKWPTRIEIVNALPRVASGHKVDKKKLREMRND
jgi:non-ribosomal peptide synthetase component E (peptide arylation enzyme)